MSWLDKIFSSLWKQKALGRSDVLADLAKQQSWAANSQNAIQVSTVFACARVIGEGIAQVPLKLMKESNGKREPAKDNPLYHLLASKPNSWQTSFEYREMMAWHLVLTGNHYSYINRGVSGGSIKELIPLDPKNVTVKQNADFSLSYEVRGKDGAMALVTADKIWHVRGPSQNGYLGLDCVKLAREAIGLALNGEDAAKRLQENGVRPSGVYSVEGTLSPDQYKALAAWIKENASGAENAGKPMILDRSAKWVNTQMTGVDAQSLETRRFQIEEICRFFRVMPIMVGYSDKAATYASAEQMFLAHVVHTLAPWFVRIEQSIDAQLLTDSDRQAGLYSNFVEEGLLRGAAIDTMNTILGYVNGGILTPNEGRALLDRNPDTDPAADQLRIPANVVGLPEAMEGSKDADKTP